MDATVYNQNGRKKYYSHRMIWEAVNQKIIPDGYQIHHINCDIQDNSIKNLELVTRQQNMIYDGIRRKGMKYKSPQNVPMKCGVFYYHHIDIKTMELINMGKYTTNKLREFQMVINM